MTNIVSLDRKFPCISQEFALLIFVNYLIIIRLSNFKDRFKNFILFKNNFHL